MAKQRTKNSTKPQITGEPEVKTENPNQVDVQSVSENTPSKNEEDIQDPHQEEQEGKQALDFNLKIAIVDTSCEAVPEGEFLSKKYQPQDAIQGAHAQNLVSFGWAHWASVEELQMLKEQQEGSD